MKRVLVVANETVAGKPLIDAVRRHAEGEDVHVHVISPQNQPKHGYVIYDEHVRDAAENRLQMTLALMREAGIEADGEVMDPDPYSAVMDALGEQDYDEIVISTHPETRSGWLRQGLVDRVQRAARRPVEHVVVDLDAERDDVKRTLVVANQTIASRPLLDALKRKASEEPRRFIVIAPQSEGQNGGGDDPHDRLAPPFGSSRTPACRRSARSSTTIPTRPSRTRSSSMRRTTSSSRPSPRPARAGCAATSSAAWRPRRASPWSTS